MVVVPPLLPIPNAPRTAGREGKEGPQWWLLLGPGSGKGGRECGRGAGRGGEGDLGGCTSPPPNPDNSWQGGEGGREGGSRVGRGGKAEGSLCEVEVGGGREPPHRRLEEEAAVVEEVCT